MDARDHFVTIAIALELSPAAGGNAVVQRTATKLIQYDEDLTPTALGSLRILATHPRAYDIYERTLRTLR